MFKIIDKLILFFFSKGILKEDGNLLAKGLRKTIFLQALSAVLVFVSSLLLVNIVKIKEYGLYVHVFNWVTIMAVVACFGMEDIVLAEIPLLLKKNKPVSGLIKHVNKLVFGVSVIISIVLLFLAYSGWLPGLYEQRYFFLLAIGCVFLTAFIVVNQQAVQAFNRIYASQASDKILKPFLLILIIGLLWLTGLTIDASTLIIVNASALLFCAVVVFIFLQNTLRAHEAGTELSQQVGIRQTITKGGYFLAISLLFMIKARVSMLIVGAVNTTENVGILNILSRLADFVFLPYSLIHAIVPQLFASHTDSDPLYKKRLFNKITIFLALAAAAIFIAIAIVGKNILQWYDASLVGYYDILLMLCGAQFLFSVFGPTSALLMMQGKQKPAAIALLFDTMFSGVIFFLLIKSFGLMGAAWGAIISSFVYNIILRTLVHVYFFRPGVSKSVEQDEPVITK